MSAPSRSVRVLCAALLAAVTYACALAAETPASASSSPARIVVGPNVLVSRDGDVPHVELMVAASPKTSKNLLGGAITATRPNGGWACRTYSSTDGGSSWKSSEFGEQIEWGGGDPQVAYTARGTALFMALTTNKNEAGRDCSSMHIWRSEDGGSTWLPPAEVTCAPSWDHEQVVVDMTKGRFAGRIYVGALYDYPVYRVGVFRSDDDGRTWTGPVEAANGGGTIGINVVTPMVLSDGTLVVPYGDFQFLPDKRPSKGLSTTNQWTVSSTDGGVTFSGPQKVGSRVRDLDDKETKFAGFGKFAADSESTKYRDRMYSVWEDARLARILFSHSSDRGKTWTAPRAIDDGIPRTAKQWQPAISVNKDGVVAVTWFDTRDLADSRQYHQYFAASLDGGDTFLPAVRVSSAPSDPHGPGNSQISPIVFVEKEEVALSFLSAASRWASGGDYMGLAADKNGVFHPFWADSRSGTFQVYTASVSVALPRADEKTAGGGASKPAEPVASAAAKPPALVESSLVHKVEFVFDPTRFDVNKKQVEMPVRLKNVSAQPIYPPIRVEITGFGFPEYESADDLKRDAENAPSALNSANGKAKEGAAFDFGGALTGPALEPGAQTNPVSFRFQFVDPAKAPTLRLKAVGMVAASPAS
jgi:hypothetical protein